MNKLRGWEWGYGLVCLLSACGDDRAKSADLPLEVPPVTDGSWYRPNVTSTWQWQLTGALNTSYDVELYDIDLFESDASLIGSLKAEGRKVICYFSAGSSEEFRPDVGNFPDNVMGNALDGWEGERWLDIRSQAVVTVMTRRLDLAQSKGCDGVEPDNVDGFANDTGFDLSSDDQLAYNRFLANEAHRRNLTVGLKNDGDQVTQLLSYFDFNLNEECHAYDECDVLAPFVAAGKPVFNAEYPEDTSGATTLAASVCPSAAVAQLRTLILPLDLDDSFRVSCD